jgi:putative transposase
MPFAQRKKTTCRKSSDLGPKECCAHAVTALDQHLTIPLQGRLTQTDLFQTLVGMAAMQQSVHSIAGFLEHVPCETSFRYHLKKLAMDDLEQKSTAILTHLVHHVLRPGNAYQFAIDYTTNPVRQEVVSGTAGKSATLSVWGVPTVACAPG